MAKCIFDNLTHEQAVCMAKWFEGQGEQDCAVWFETNEIKPPLANCRHPKGYFEILDNENIIVHCYTP